MNTNKSYSMDMLPEEIWCEIIQRMSAKERNPLRIASRQWKDCCYRRSIQKTEKLHLPGVSHIEDIVSTLLTSERSVMNLKFSNQRLDGPDLPLWLQCGMKIEKLELENCSITLSSMQEILTHCPNLSYLALKNTHIVENQISERPLNQMIISIRSNYADSEIFTSLRRNKVIAGSVKTLIIQTEELVTRRALAALLSIFPNVKDFEFHCQHMSPGLDEEGPYAQVDYYLKSYTCRQFAEYVASNLLQLENMKVRISSDCKCDKFVQETPFFRLKTAEFCKSPIPSDPLNENDIESYSIRMYRFIPSTGLKYLTSIEMSDNASTGDIIQALRGLTGLRKIKMKLSKVKDISEFSQIYKALAHSKLNSVTIDNKLNCQSFRNLRDDNALMCGIGLPINITVKELQLTTQGREPTFLSIFMRCFSQLTHLKLIVRSPELNLMNIFYPQNLKSIELVSSKKRYLPYHPCTLQVQNVSSKTFIRGLEYLSVEISILKQLLAREPSIYFVDLRYLHISSHGGIPPRFNDRKSKQVSLIPWELNCFPLRNLEGVYMDVHFHTDDILTFFSDPKKFPRIQYIGIRILGDNFATYKKWFESWFDHCPCLTTIFVMNMLNGFCLFYDPVKGEIRRCSPKTFHAYERYDDDLAEMNPTLKMFRHFYNLESFFNLWKNNS